MLREVMSIGFGPEYFGGVFSYKSPGKDLVLLQGDATNMAEAQDTALRIPKYTLGLLIEPITG